MAPKRKAKVVKTTRKVVQQTVQVAVVDSGNKLVAELEQQEAETSSQKILQEEREGHVLKTTITVEAGGKSSSSLPEAEQVTINVPTDQPQKTAAAAETPVTPSPRPERRRKIAIEDKEREEMKEKGREELMEEERPEDKMEEGKEGGPERIKVHREQGEREEETRATERPKEGEEEDAQETETQETEILEGTQVGRGREETRKEETRATKSLEDEGGKVDQEQDKTEQEVRGNEDSKAEEGTEKKRRGGRKGEGRRRRRKRRSEGVGEEQYKRYVFTVLKQVHPGLAISSVAMEILNAYMNDMFERLADEAAKLSSYTGIKTLSAREIQGAVRLVLPGELGKHAIAEGTKAVANYMAHENVRRGRGGGNGHGSAP